MTTRNSRRRRLFFGGVCVVLGLLLGAVAAEVLTRVFWQGPLVTGSLVVNHPVLGSGLRQGACGTGVSPEFRVRYCVDREWGVRAADPSLSAAAHPVAVFGDSFVFGHGVEFAQVFTERLNAEQGRRLFFNAGIFNYGPDQEFAWARELRPRLKPALEIACFYEGNDFQDFGRFGLLTFGESGVAVGRAVDPAGESRRRLTGLFFYPWLCRLHLWGLAKAILQRRVTAPVAAPSGAANEISADTVARLAALYRQWSRDVDGRLLVVIIPDRQRFTAGTVKAETVALRQALAAEKVEAVDLADGQAVRTADMPGEPAALYYAADGHWTPQGHAWAAQGLRRQLHSRSEWRELIEK